MLGEPITDVLEQILDLRDKNNRSHFRVIVFLDKPGELNPFNSIRDTVRMLATHCTKHHSSMSNHGCELIMGTGVRLPAYDLPKVLFKELDKVQLEIYKHNKRKYEALRTSIKR